MNCLNCSDSGYGTVPEWILRWKKDRYEAVGQGMRIYTSHYYYMELNATKMLHDLNLDFEITNANLIRRINKIEKNTELYLDDMQKTAVIMETVKAWSDDP